MYCLGAENVPPDTLSRTFCAPALSGMDLGELHNLLCHPGVTRMFHFVKSRNLPYSIEDMRQMTKACRICAEHKPQFHLPVQAHMIKTTQPFQRLNVDFKGPLKSNNQNTFFLNIIDEYSHFLFVFQCKDVGARILVQGCWCKDIGARMLVHAVSLDVYASFSQFMGCQHISTLTRGHLL